MALLSILGPIAVGEDQAYSAVLLGSRIDTAVEVSPEAAARRVLARTSGAVLVDERHAVLAARLGLPTAAPDEEQRRALALTALGMVNGRSLEKITDRDLLVALSEALREYEEAEPWRYFDSDYAAPVTVTGALGRERELCVLGAAGEQLGLVIYGTRGAAQRLRESTHEGLHDLALRLDAMVLYLELEPRWAQDLLRDGVGLDVIPLVHRQEHGRFVPIRADEMRLLIASLRAVAAMVRARGSATGSFEYRGKRVDVALEPGVAFSADPIHPAPRPSPLHALDARVSGKLLAFARTLRGFTDAWLTEGVLAKAKGLAESLSLYVRPFDGTPIAIRAEQAGALDAEEARWARAVAASPVSLFEVEAVSDSGQVALIDLLTGTHLVASDAGVSLGAVPREVFLARPVAFERETVLVGAWEQSLGPRTARAVRDAFRGEAKSAEPERSLRLLELALQPPPLEVDPGELPGVRTTDGDPVVEVTDRYVVRGGGAIAQTIAGLPDMLRDGAGEFTWTRIGNAVHPGWRRTALAAIDVAGNQITVRTQSIPRADAARALLASTFGSRLVEQGRTEAHPRLAEGSETASITMDEQATPQGPWIRLYAELDELAFLRGLLGDAKDPVALERVHGILCEREWVLAAHGDPMEELDPDRPPLDMRRLLGIGWHGEFLGPDTAFAALGAGIPLSLALPALVQPVRDELGGSERDLYALTVELWNRSRDADADPQAILDAVLGARRNDPVARDAAAWMLAQARNSFGHDRREVVHYDVQEVKDGATLTAMWSIDKAHLGASVAVNVPPPYRALVEYDPENEPDPGSWALVPPAWRKELVAAALRESERHIGQPFEVYAARWAELEDALATGKPKKLVDALRQSERALGSRGRALATFAIGLTLRPGIKIGARTQRPLSETIDELLELVDEAVAKRGGA